MLQIFINFKDYGHLKLGVYSILKRGEGIRLVCVFVCLCVC